MPGQEAKYQQVIDWVKRNIEDGTFREGDKLMSENEMSSRFGLSRQTIRRATGELVNQKLVTRMQGSGTYIGSQLPEALQAENADSMAPAEADLRRPHMNIAVISTFNESYIFPGILKGIGEVLTDHGYAMQVSFTDNRLNREAAILQMLLEKDSIDVLFLGSSVVVNAFIPQEIYNEYGIRSYNLGSEQQSIYLSYYWLKEALRFQKPKAVVLDLKYMWNIHPNDVINTVEPLARKCLDPMKWSSVKFEAVHNLCQLNESQSELSFYLTNLRFHSRWSEIQEYDFNDEMVKSYSLKGFGPMTAKGPDSYTTFEQKDKSVKTEFAPLMQDYLDRITELCKENDIRLILIDIPGNYMNDAVNNTHTDYAERNGIEYYNMCSTLYYNQIGAKLPEEKVFDHSNIWGAIKTSRFIGKILRDEYGIGSVYDEQYEASREYYEQVLSSSNLVRITGQEEYLNALKNPNYAVFITLKSYKLYSKPFVP